MLNHRSIWKAIDSLAARYGYTPSGLARQAGLDPTAFNKSKRFGPNGRPRWPSTESIAAILRATGGSLAEFTALAGGGARSVPSLGLARAMKGGCFDDKGRPSGRGWKTTSIDHADNPDLFALEVSGDAYAPALKDGDVVLVSPGATLKAGDRVVAMTEDGELLVREVTKLSGRRLQLAALVKRQGEKSYDQGDFAWIARIAWVGR